MELPQPYKDMIYSNNCDERTTIKAALEFLPDDILEKWKDQLAILTMDRRHGIRVSEDIRKNKELIFLSDKVWPPVTAKETDLPFRFFAFVVLHEIAHVELKHTTQNKDEEEPEADKKAMEWFNAHMEKLNISKTEPIPLLTCNEISENKDFIEGRDWTYNSRKCDVSGFFCVKLYSDEIAPIFEIAERENVSVEVLLRRLLRDFLKTRS